MKYFKKQIFYFKYWWYKPILNIDSNELRYTYVYGKPYVLWTNRSVKENRKALTIILEIAGTYKIETVNYNSETAAFAIPIRQLSPITFCCVSFE